MSKEVMRFVGSPDVWFTCDLCTREEEKMWGGMSWILPNGIEIEIMCNACHEAIMMSIQMTSMAIIGDHGGIDRFNRKHYTI